MNKDCTYVSQTDRHIRNNPYKFFFDILDKSLTSDQSYAKKRVHYLPLPAC